MIKFIVQTLALVSLFSLSQTAKAVSHTNIEGRLQFPDRTPFNGTAPVTLDHGVYWAYPKIDGSFIFRNIPPGVHILDVQSTTHHFGQVKIQLLEENDMQPKCVEYAYPGAAKKPLEHPVVMTAYATLEYFEKRPAFSVFSILKNPMFLMMAFSAGMMFLMPKMMEGLDPEEKARMKEQMAMQQDPNKMLSNLFEGFTGGGESESAPKKKIKK